MAKQKKVQNGSLLNLCAEYKAVLSAMPTQPNAADKQNQNELLKFLVDRGYFAKAELLDIFSTHSADSSLINWKNPGTHNPGLIGTPVFEEYGGYTGVTATNALVRSNFIPSQHAQLITYNNMTIMMGIATNVDENKYDFGAYDGVRSLRGYIRNSTNRGVWLNSIGANNVSNTNSIGHYAFSKNSNDILKANKNTTLSTEIANVSDTQLVTKELAIGGRNNNGTWEAGSKQIRYFFVFSYLQPVEIDEIIYAIEKYLDAYTKGLFSEKIMIANPADAVINEVLTGIGVENETIHPSVLKLNFGGYNYWQANTPYPKKDYPADYLQYEVPNIYASNDGVNWNAPVGLTNPIEPVVAGKFSPDTELYFENNTLYCFFQQLTGATPYFKYLKSTDGISWTNKTQLNMTALAGVSPSVVKIGNTYYIYYVINEGSDVFSVRRSSSNSLTGDYSNEETITLVGLGSLYAWHIDIVKIGDVYWMTILSRDYTKLYLAGSTDGLTFTVANSKPVMEAANFNIDSFYRGGVLEDGNSLKMYYTSVTKTTKIYKLAYCKIRMINA